MGIKRKRSKGRKRYTKKTVSPLKVLYRQGHLVVLVDYLAFLY